MFRSWTFECWFDSSLLSLIGSIFLSIISIGLRKGALLSAGLIALAAAIRCIPVSGTLLFWCVSLDFKNVSLHLLVSSEILVKQQWGVHILQTTNHFQAHRFKCSFKQTLPCTGTRNFQVHRFTCSHIYANTTRNFLGSNHAETIISSCRLSLVGALLGGGMAGVYTFGGPPLVSAVWFPAHQRATATSILSLFNYAGVAASFVIGESWFEILWVAHNFRPRQFERQGDLLESSARRKLPLSCTGMGVSQPLRWLSDLDCLTDGGGRNFEGQIPDKRQTNSHEFPRKEKHLKLSLALIAGNAVVHYQKGGHNHTHSHRFVLES